MSHKFEMTQSTAPVHVSPDLIRPFPYGGRGKITTAKPHSFLAEMHRGPAVIWAQDGWYGACGAWVPRRFSDIQKIYRDMEHFSSRGMSPFAPLFGETWHMIPIETDAPLHTLFRTLLNPIFTPARMAAFEHKIREHASRATSQFKANGGCEFVADFALEFPIRVFLDFIGLPQERIGDFLTWVHKILRSADPQEIAGAVQDVVSYLESECDDRRRNPRDDLLTFGTQAELNGRKMSSEELSGFSFTLFMVGLDTVSAAMSFHFRHLAERSDHQNFLRSNWHCIPDAVNELMRAYPTSMTSRRCIAETKISDVTIKPGDMVVMSTLLAGHDPEVFENPDVVDFNRKPQHLSFGYGPHLCIGMHLAKRELKVAIEEFLAEIPEFRIEAGVEIVSDIGAVVRPRSLPLVFNI